MVDARDLMCGSMREGEYKLRLMAGRFEGERRWYGISHLEWQGLSICLKGDTSTFLTLIPGFLLPRRRHRCH